MKIRVTIAAGLLVAAMITAWPAQVSAVGRAVADTVHQAYVGHFIDKSTFLRNCL